MSKNLEVVNCIEDMMDSTRSSVFLPGKEEYRRDNDIVLAAELGKVLLDRNRSLEQALQESRLSEQEKTAEIKFLVEQLAYLRESSLQKSAFADQADCYNQELDRNNRRLVQEMMADKRKIERMSVKIARLEEQVTNLLDRLAEYESVDGPRHSLHSGTRPSSGSSDRRNMDPTQFTPSSITASSDYPQIFIDDEFVDQPQLGAYLSRDTLKPSSPEYTRQLAAPYLRLPCPSRKDSSQLSYSSPCLLQMDIKEPASVLNKTFNLTRGSRVSTKTHDRNGDQLMPQQVYDILEEYALSPHVQPHRPSSEINGGKYDRMEQDSRDLRSLLDDASFLRSISEIDALKLHYQIPNLTASDYQPGYRQLFRETFKMLHDLKETPRKSSR